MFKTLNVKNIKGAARINGDGDGTCKGLFTSRESGSESEKD